MSREVSYRFLRKWLAASRSRLFVAVLVPALLGSAVAWSEGYFSWPLFLLTLLGLVMAESANLLMADWAVYAGREPALFRGEPPPPIEGSPMIPERWLPSRYALHAGLSSLAAAGLVFVYLLSLRGWPIMALSALALVVGFLYILSPVRFGFFSTALLPPAVASGAYNVLSDRLSWRPLLAGMPLVFLSIGAIFIYRVLYRPMEREKFDRRRGRLRWLYALCYVTLSATAISKVVSPWALLSLLTIPLVFQVEKFLDREKEDYLPATSAAVLLYTSTGVLIALGHILATVFP